MSEDRHRKERQPVYYEDNTALIKDELRKLDLLIRRRVIALRREIASIPKPLAHPLYISHEEVDWLLTGPEVLTAGESEIEELERQIGEISRQIGDRQEESRRRCIALALPQLTELFGLSFFDRETVVICLAPELDRKYDKLYAYLQDDLTRKRPSSDLVADLLCATEADQWQGRSYFSGSSALLRAGIVQKIDDPQSPSGSSGLAQFLKLDSRIVRYLLGVNTIDERLADCVTMLHHPVPMDEVFVSPAVKAGLLRLLEGPVSQKNGGRKNVVLYLRGPYGAGRKELAQGICHRLQCPLLAVDTEYLVSQEFSGRELLRLIVREGLLLPAPLYFSPSDALFRDDDKAKGFLRRFARAIDEQGWFTVLAGSKPWPRKGNFGEASFYEVELPAPDLSMGQAAWHKALPSLAGEEDPSWTITLANQFHLTPGQIRDAAEAARREGVMNGEQRGVTLPNLFKACRNQSNRKLGELSLKVEPRYEWGDLVLPEEKITQLREICSQVKHRHRVYDEWGFGRKLAYGKGLSILFTGPSGTGKTMAAEVIAREVGLDLYKIDLSGVVSKYIGETEKNLSRVFQEAESSNAVLFFDEADALFGKRTDVSDAHDRYANIETSYLLQKMEQYEGIAILATNLRENMDEAFTRRIRFVVEFPFPDNASRLRIWQTHFPKEAPASEAIDYDYLSKELEIAGGNIRNIVLNAAFSAAENGGVITMEHVLHGAKREYEKIGKLWTEPLPFHARESRMARGGRL